MGELSGPEHEAEHQKFMTEVEATLTILREQIRNAPCDTMLKAGIVRVAVEAGAYVQALQESMAEVAQEEAESASAGAEASYERDRNLARTFGLS